MHTTFRRALVAGALATAVLGGTTSVAHADDTVLDCDAAAAAVETAQTAADEAKQAFISFTRAGARQQVALLKDAELREARQAARAEQKAARDAAKELRGTARREAMADLREARKVAREEAQEAREVVKASRQALKSLVKAERRELKTTWDDAKAALEAARLLAENCTEGTDETDGTEETGGDTTTPEA